MDRPVKPSDYARWVDAMHLALGAQDERAFQAAMRGFNSVNEPDMVTGVRRVTDELRSALERFRLESQLADLAGRQVPDARQRLAHVLKLTDEAAHRTLDLVEQCGPLTALTESESERLLNNPPGVAAALHPEVRAVLDGTRERMQRARTMFGEVLLAQGFQDITGQIIRGVMTLVDELEQSLGELIQLTGGSGQLIRPLAANGVAGNELEGPVVPGVQRAASVSAQTDVDDLLSNLGM